MSEHVCKQCGEAASVNFTWITTQGPQRTKFCDRCAKAWFDKYKHTPSGQTLQIAPVVNVSTDH